MHIPIEISARHVHLRRQDLEKLFGPNYKLKKLKNLSQLSDFAAEETVELIGEKASFSKVRIIGPCRKHTQAEISRTDAFFLGVPAILKLSGDIKDTPGIIIRGPKGEVKLKRGVIIAKRHLHASPKSLSKLGVKTGDAVSVKVGGKRAITFNNIIIRSHPKFKLALHLDTDEANAAWIDQENNFGELIK